jgi:hypothetical protein
VPSHSATARLAPRRHKATDPASVHPSRLIARLLRLRVTRCAKSVPGFCGVARTEIDQDVQCSGKPRNLRLAAARTRESSLARKRPSRKSALRALFPSLPTSSRHCFFALKPQPASLGSSLLFPGAQNTFHNQRKENPHTRESASGKFRRIRGSPDHRAEPNPLQAKMP